MNLLRVTPWVLASVVWAEVLVAAPKVSPKTRAAAQKIYVDGTRSYRAGQLGEALAAFRSSYEMVPSPNSHLMVARTLRDSGDLVGAFIEYERIIPEARAAMREEAKYNVTADAAVRELAAVRQKIALVTIRVDAPPDQLKVTMGEREVKADSWGKPIPVMPGRLLITASVPDRPDDKREPLAQRGEEVVVDLTFRNAPVPEPLDKRKPALGAIAADAPTSIPRQEPLADSRPAAGGSVSSQKTWAYVAGGAGLAGIATFALFGALTRSHYNDLEKACMLGHCPPEMADDINAGRREQVIANVGLTLGLLGVGVGTTLWLTADSPGSNEESARLRPQIRLGSRGVSFAGSF